MIEPPTRFELDVLHAVLDDQRARYPALYGQIPLLGVRSRELTGVGAYINFDLPEDPAVPIEQGRPDAVLTGNKTIVMDDPPSGLAFAVGVSGGRIDLLELVTYGDETWDGTVGRYRIASV
jgi:hypothetical protein